MSDREQVQEEDAGRAHFASLGLVAGELMHDLANLAVVIRGRTTLALSDARIGRNPLGELERLSEASEEMSAMLRDVMDTLRGQALSAEVTFAPQEVIERVVRRFLESAPSLEIRLVSQLPAEVRVAGRTTFFSRAVANLLSNAARYARSEIRIVLDLETGLEGPRVVAAVEDDGPGVPAARRETVFEPLVRDGAGTGAGLGLSSVAWAAAQLGGEACCTEARTLGGARFEVRMPAVGQVVAFRPAPAIDLLAGVRLALIEDDVAVRTALMRLLGRRGAAVHAIAPSSLEDEDALVFEVARALPDVILLDLGLGSRSGLDVWQRLAARAPEVARRVIFLSGLGAGDAVWDAACATGQPVLAKPLDVEELADAIAQVRNQE
ncbi:MAG TPA: hybrid sensor histidine kinase/response regulator [Longimicrobiaceae bacterium]|jgi:ActR/RegA family two-component response regulator/two-component sensor histidine kinase|nr:hybrid sensor histidine kinase/response regulator [Longimicrobiaceae bacterium]